MAMKHLRGTRKIIDRLAVKEEASALAALKESERGAALLGCYRTALDAGVAGVRNRFEEDQDGELCVQGTCHLIDQIIRVIFEIASDYIYPAANPTPGDQVCIVAYGGYGRGELAPKSDVDLLFVLPYKKTGRSEQIVEHILYMLWDLGLKVGHATRSLDECIRQAKGDITIRTGLLESRYVWGEQSLYLQLRKRFWQEVAAGTGPEFVDAKLHERDDRHRQMGDTRYVLEPNIKEGKGGIRDLQTLFWIAKYLYKVDTVAALVDKDVFTAREVAKFDKAQAYLWAVRCHLHYLAGRPEERLTFDVQPELARRMGYTDRAGILSVERFMRHYFLVAKDVGDLTRIFCAALEAKQQRQRRFSLPRLGLWSREMEGFPMASGRLTLPFPKHFAEKPVDMIRLFEVSQRNRVEIHPDALQTVTRNLRRIDKALRVDPEACALFMKILMAKRDTDATLRLMNEAGVLGKFLPDFGRVVAQMQYDMYHVYTTDEHTIRALGILGQIERGELKDELPTSSEVIHKVLSREVLYMSVLLHDIAKGRGGDHSVLGAKVAERLCPRFGFTPAQTETVAWLVLHHLDMSNTAFKRDLDDPKTVTDFADLVQSPERLRLLLCLTAADIRAVGPGRWNNWKATLLRELYYQAESAMSGGYDSYQSRDRAAKIRHKVAEALSDWPEAEREAHIARGEPSYWLFYDLATLVRHAKMIRAAHAAEKKLAIDTTNNAGRAVTELTVYTGDHPGLFNKIAAAIAVTGATIVDARINTLMDGMALDTFWIQDSSGAPVQSATNLSRLAERVELSLSGRFHMKDELAKRAPMPSRTRMFNVPPQVFIDNKASNSHTVIEVNGRDRPGLIYDLTRVLQDLSLQVSSAKVSTFGERVVDVFYVKNLFGTKIDHPEKLRQIRESLLEVLGGPCKPAAKEEPKKAAAKETAKKRARKAPAKNAKPAKKEAASAK
jgi:[protein-PII] uridylyltransferase